MRPVRLLLTITTLFVFATTLAHADQIFPWRPREPVLKASAVNWSSVNERLSEELDHASIGDLARREVSAPPVKDPATWLRRLALFVRAEYRQDVMAMLKSRFRPLTSTMDWRLTGLANDALQYRDLELARRVAWLYPEENYGPLLLEILTRGMPPSEADKWLSRNVPEGDGQWREARMRYRAKRGDEAALLAPFEQALRAHPDDIEAAGRYLWAVRAAEKPRDVGWMASLCTPRLAVQSLVLGRAIESAGSDATSLYLRSLSTPYRAEDDTWYRGYTARMHFAYLPRDLGLSEESLRRQTRQALANAYRKGGRFTEAKSIEDELAAMSRGGPHRIPVVTTPPSAAPEVGRASNLRLTEHSSADYWFDRAMELNEAKEYAEAAKAFHEALVLTARPTTEQPTRRLQLVRGYANAVWLRDSMRPTEAYRILSSELTTVPPQSDYASELVAAMLNYDSGAHLIDPADDALWAFLHARSDWTEQLPLLQRMAQDATPDHRASLLARLEAEAKLNPAGRASAVAETMLALDARRRAIPWFEAASTLSPVEYWRRSAIDRLWSAYQAIDDWHAMERLLAGCEEMNRTSAQKFYLTGHLLEIAITAAKVGAKPEAMRYFERWANQDRRLAPHFYPLPGYGLTDQLQAYYRRMAIDEPRSETPRRVHGEVGL